MDYFIKKEFEVDNGELVQYNGVGGDVVIPYGVISIGSRAFDDNGASIMSLTLPKSIMRIDTSAFWRCRNLSNFIVDEDNSKYCTIDGNLYSKDKKELVLCARAKNDFTFPKGITSIGAKAFHFCDIFTNITIPESVTTIGARAFACCGGITNITIPNGVTTINDYTFNGCSGLTNIAIPESVTTIGKGAFNGCSGLTNITIPKGVTTINNNTFEECSGLTNITIPNGVTTIGVGAFQKCSGLTSVTIPNSVKEIYYMAFNGAKNLTEIIFLGTKAEWKSINKIKSDRGERENWNYGMPKYVVKCSNGDVKIGLFYKE